MPMLARHIASVTDEALARLAAQAGQPIDLLATMQTLALDIAGRSMFSLEMDRYGAAMRRFLARPAVLRTFNIAMGALLALSLVPGLRQLLGSR